MLWRTKGRWGQWHCRRRVGWQAVSIDALGARGETFARSFAWRGFQNLIILDEITEWIEVQGGRSFWCR